MGFPGGLDSKEAACNAGDLGSIPGLGRSPGEGKGYPVFWPGEFHRLYSPWGCKESNMTFNFQYRGWGSIPVQGAKAPCALWPKNQNRIFF